MELKELSKEELIGVYNALAVRHFPPDELKETGRIQEYLENGLYSGFGLFQDSLMLSYALFFQIPGENFMLLDYYAVLEAHRGDGIGSRYLQLMKRKLREARGIYIESENPETAAQAEEKEMRRKRVSFYLRNGAVSTGLTSCLFGVSYSILYLPVQETSVQPDYFHELDTIYRNMFPPKVYEEHVKLSAES